MVVALSIRYHPTQLGGCSMTVDPHEYHISPYEETLAKPDRTNLIVRIELRVKKVLLRNSVSNVCIAGDVSLVWF